jgi:hypothetical protein
MKTRGVLRFDPRQERIHRRLALIGEGPAAFYRDAVRMLDEDFPLLESGAHLLAHCVREIESALRKVLLPLAPTLTTESEPKAKGKKGKRDDTHAREVAQIIKAYGIQADGDAARIWARVAEGELPKWAHRDALMQPRAVDDAYRDLWREWEEMLDAVLDRFEARFGEHVLMLQALAAEQAPTATHLDRLRNKVPNNHVSLTAFFSQMGASWLPLLREGGYFANPPGPDMTRNDAYHPPWAASQALVRMIEGADYATRTLIGDIASDIPETSNPWVGADLATIACHVDLDVAVQLARRLGPQLRRDHSLRLPETLTNLALRLTTEEQLDPAIELLRELVTVNEGGALTVNAFELERCLPRLVPPLFRARALDAIAALADSLDRMLRVTMRNDEEVSKDDGASFRAAIESSAQNIPGREQEASILIEALRDGCAVAVGQHAEAAPAIVQALLGRDLLIFKRIALHLVATFPQAAPSELEQMLLDRGDLESIPLWHERRQLEGAAFRYLTPEAQRAFLDQIKVGPDVDAYRKSTQAWAGEPASEPEVREYVLRWRREHLAMVAEHLPADVRTDYDAIVAEYGPASHPTFLSPLGKAWSGPSSPRSQTELAAMSPGELVAWLKEWTPVPRFDGPFASREGLLRELKKVVAAGPEPWATDAPAFGGLHPTYVRALVEGLSDAIRQKRPFPWAPVLELCEKAVGQAVDDAVGIDAAIDRDEDPSWRWARRAISDLLVDGLREGPAAIPDELLRRIFPMLQAIRATPEQRSGLRDPMDEALNTIAGSTMQGIILLALRRGIMARRDGDSVGLGSAPEARDVLDSCLATSEPLLGSRAMIGAHLSQLVLLDSGWVSAHRDQLFPGGDQGKALRDAVWDAYLQHGSPTKLAFETLREPFQERAAEVAAEGKQQRVTALLNHLAPLYWSGLVALSEPGALQEFYRCASPESRAALLKHIGFSIFHDTQPIEASVFAKAQALWEHRVSVWSKGDTSAAIEAVPFGWWFSSGKFDLEWSLKELRRALSFTPRLDLDFAVAEQLAVTASTRPQEAIELLTVLVTSEGGAHVGVCRKGIRQTVLAVRANGNEAAVTGARELVSRLVARGYQDFVDLL